MSEEKSSRRSSRRSEKGVSAKQQALDRIKNYRKTGERVEYSVEEDGGIYDLVGEEEYAQIVQDRQEEDFIVDDDGTGYQDDGREIFDDDPNEKPVSSGKNAKSKSKDSSGKPAKKTTKITSMFGASSNPKRKDKPNNVTLQGDDFLEDILNSMKTSEPPTSLPSSNSATVKTPKLLKKHAPRRLSNEKSSGEKKVTIKRKPFTNIVPQNILERKSPMEIKKEVDVVDRKVEEDVVDVYVHDEESAIDHHIPLPNNDDDVMDNVVSVKKEPNESYINEDELNDGVDELMDSIVKEEEVTVKSEFITDKWHTMFDEKREIKDAPTQCDISSFPTVKVDDEEVVRLFWLDAYEDRFTQPGVVYLFGKVWSDVSKSYVSCCVSVRNIERQLYVLPRKMKRMSPEEAVEFNDIYAEFDQKVANKYKIMEYKCRKVEKRYAFDKPDVPHVSEYLEVMYGAGQPSIPGDIEGDTFSHIFGTNTSSLELLLLNCKLLGPSWIDLKYPQKPKAPISWCKFEIVIDQPGYLMLTKESPPPPPLNVLSLSMVATTHPKTHAHEIISFAGLIQPDMALDKGAPENCFANSFCLVTKPSDELLPYDFQSSVQKSGANINISSSERSLLGLLLAKIQTIDPDVIIGHDIQGFDFDVLLQRLSSNKVPHWSKVGRLKRSNLPNTSNKQASDVRNIAVGRLVVDIKISGKELIRCKSYDLTELVSVVLSKTREEVLSEDVAANIRKTDSLLKMLNYNRLDAMYALQVMYELNIVPLAYQITGICGNVMSRTLLGGRSERNEYLLLHAFSEKNYILPDKVYNQKNKFNKNDEGAEGSSKRSKNKKPSYTGGLVLEPKKGFYDKYILLLDFNSLYPSIIQEYNICFTTIACEPPSNENPEGDYLPELPSAEQDAGILPTEIKRLVERRRQVKALLKATPTGSDLYMQYDIRQKALKLTANSMYGCLGFSFSRFYAKALAALVTGKGREILLKTKDLATELGLDVIYGDTDSIMINTNSQDIKEVRKIGAKVKAAVNRLYRLVEIEIDGIFKCMLLLKKKKYAAILADVKADGTIVERTELKGLDIVRRDWSELAKDAGNYVLSQILSCGARDTIIENIHDYLSTMREMVEKGKCEISKFEINKSLTKKPDEYPDKKSLPHVTVAQRLMSQGRHVAVGDTISYVICDDGSGLPATQRAYHVDEMTKNVNLKIDNHYYLSSQVHPVVSRLCEPMEGTDAAIIAQCLGLDPSSYKSQQRREESQETQLNVLMTDEERFKDVDKFMIQCGNEVCSLHKQDVEFQGSFDVKVDPLNCGACHASYNIKHLINAVRLFIRERIERYYMCWMVCDDPTCGYTTRQVSVKYLQNTLSCQSCNKGNIHAEYNDGKIYNQLFYLSHMLDVNASASEEVKRLRSKDPRWNELAVESENVLSSSAYAVVNILNLFSS